MADLDLLRLQRIATIARWLGVRPLWVAFWFVLALFSQPLYAQSAEDGQSLFQEKCIACHTIGGGPGVGPDLAGVAERRERAWLTEWLLAPDKMLAANDAIAMQLLQQSNNVPMPNLGLTESQVAALIDFLAGPQSEPVIAVQKTLASGDAVQGRALFTGDHRLTEGGPPCMTCHSIAGLGTLGGGALGPDLTAAYTTYGGDNGLALYLETLPTVTMSAVWNRQPLTPAEQDDLRAFLREASMSERAPEAVWRLTGISVFGAALMMVAAHFTWRRRLVSVRKDLVRRSRI